MRGANLIIVAAPSGAGKTSLVTALLQSASDLEVSLSFTTRAARPGEVDGRDYRFISEVEFLQRRDRGEFLESAQVHGNFYATSRAWIEQRLACGVSVILEIDWQGARQVRGVFPHSASIFILPPSLAVLEQRLRARAQDSDEVIGRRLAAARDEMRHLIEFDYVILNSDFDVALEDLRAIVRSQSLSTDAQRQLHPDLFHSLLAP